MRISLSVLMREAVALELPADARIPRRISDRNNVPLAASAYSELPIAELLKTRSDVSAKAPEG